MLDHTNQTAQAKYHVLDTTPVKHVLLTGIGANPQNNVLLLQLQAVAG
jgi:hypothetical protein